MQVKFVGEELFPGNQVWKIIHSKYAHSPDEVKTGNRKVEM